IAKRLSAGSRGLAAQEGLAPIKTADVTGDAAVFIAFATAAGKIAQDGDGGHSPFTQALLNNLKTPVSIDDMFSMVTKEVSAATKNTQRPYKYASLDSIVCLTERCGGAAAPGAAAAAPSSSGGLKLAEDIDPENKSWLVFGVGANDGARYYLARES